MPEELHDLLAEYKAGLQALYGSRLVGVYLYGSYARGDQDSESDVDLLIVLDRIERYGAEIETTSYLNSELSLKYNVTVSLVFMQEQKWLESDTPLLQNVRLEGIPA